MRPWFAHLREAAPEQGVYFGTERTFVPYRELHARACGAAAHFRALGFGQGRQVLFPFGSSAEAVVAFFGLLGAGATPLSIRPALPGNTSAAYGEYLAALRTKFGVDAIACDPASTPVAFPADLALLDLAAVPEAAEGLAPQPRAAEELAFVQFSSGSTLFPKGVPISFAMIEANLAAMCAHDGRSQADHVASWLPLYHDMGLVGGLLSCIYAVHRLSLISPQEFLLGPIRWLEQLSEQRATGSVMPNFGVTYLLRAVRDLDPEDARGWDLSRVRCIYLGSEPINLRNLEELEERLAPHGLRRGVFTPCYGLAEAVLMVSACQPCAPRRTFQLPSGVRAVSCGPPLPMFELRLRREDGSLAAEGELGEIELSGGSTFGGYYGMAGRGDAPFVVGDLAVMHGGELFVCGRTSDRIKVGAQSYFASDLEHVLEALPFVRPGRLAALQHEERVVVLIECRDQRILREPAAAKASVVAVIQERVGLKIATDDVLLIVPGQIERTSSGKIRRHALEQAYAQGAVRLSRSTAAPAQEHAGS